MNPWYLLYCKRSEQTRATVNLNRQGVDCYYPKVTVEKMKRGKRVQVEEPLFPCYMFVSFDLEKVSFTSVRSTRGVSDFVRFGAYPQEVAKELIFSMMSQEDNDDYREQLNDLPTEGDRCTIQSGQFEGFDAIYKEPDGDKRSIMLVTMMGKQVEVSVPNTSI
ncbi:transcription/translation regulatory transformer protein RfaH [Thaumasiovibrio subtropicus]|uniref:transcription/translation regulatory transformer protein RfaH n=1 Tax=Thaumasiovibrio subtropicus TaxID=1891207 RepID=UPI000B356DE3|nr:transcription/translation regulatory transformer protein RfaH [Thaumasiovibrio subtropicus]